MKLNKYKIKKTAIILSAALMLSPLIINEVYAAPAVAKGIRNNNPGNIRYGAHFKGENGVAGGFVTFETPEYGIRATSRLLLTYSEKYGYNTIDTIINRWAPPADDNKSTEIGNYQNYVASKLGVSRDTPLDLRDPQVLSVFTEAIIHFENNGNPYDAITISNGVAMALDTPVADYVGSPGQSGGLATTAAIPEYSEEQLRLAGCDAEIWERMLGHYKGKAERHTVIANEMQVQNQIAATPEKIESCYDQASQLVDNARRSYNTIVSIFMGGGMNSDDLYDFAERLVIDQACSQVSNYITQTGIGSMINYGNGMVDGFFNKEVGKVGNKTVNFGDLMSGSGYERDQSGKWQIKGDITSGDMAKTVNDYVVGGGVGGGIPQGNSSGGFWNSINPFK